MQAMPEPFRFVADGRHLAAEPGTSLAAALENAGVHTLRRSVKGEARGVLCAMGVCFECRVTVDGVAHQRACMTACREGMHVTTDGKALSAQPSALSVEREVLECDVAVVGAGPAGIAAACRSAESGARTLILDEGPAPGGQIYRPQAGGHGLPLIAREWIDRLGRSHAARVFSASVFDAAAAPAGFELHAETPGRRLRVRASRLVLATGARELFLPFPGWTLPGVMGAGGAQALLKSGAAFQGRTAVIAGSGPLLFPVAASLAKAGARVVLVAEQAPLMALLRFAPALARARRKLGEAVRYRTAFRRARYRTGAWVAEARGKDRVEAAIVTDGGKALEIPCDLLAVSWGLTPNTELPRLLGCALDQGRVVVDARRQTSVPGVYCAGEPCGVAGADVALAEGEIAGLAAADRWDAGTLEGGGLLACADRGRRLARAMDRAFRPREELKSLARANTIVCRCEDVPLSRLDPTWGAREAKLATRAGMGPCQGRVCGPALAFLFGWDSDTVRPPARPAALGSLMAMEEHT
ncbi:MAG: FAD-dependent oxidoreductase [Acidobacteriota bacterium]